MKQYDYKTISRTMLGDLHTPVSTYLKAVSYTHLQPLDHRRPEKSSFRQRVIVSHVGFDRPTVIVTEGYGAYYALNPKYREDVYKRQALYRRERLHP